MESNNAIWLIESPGGMVVFFCHSEAGIKPSPDPGIKKAEESLLPGLP